MKKIDKAVKIFLKSEKLVLMEDKAETPEYIEGLKETIVNMYCPSTFGLVDRGEFCGAGKARRCRECWEWKKEVS